MLLALGCVTVIALALVAFAYSQQRAHQEAQAQWGLERRELLNRVQHPERVVAAAASAFVLPDREEDIAAARDWARIGEVTSISDSYGLSDDDG